MGRRARDLCAASAVWLTALFFALSGVACHAGESARPAYAEPKEVWWDDSRAAFVIWQRGPNTWVTLRQDGVLTKSDEAAGKFPVSGPLSEDAQRLLEVIYSETRKPIALAHAGSATFWSLTDRGPLSPPHARDSFSFPAFRPEMHQWINYQTQKGNGTFTSSFFLKDMSNARSLAAPADRSFVAIAHLIPKSNLPSTQIEQGWVFTNAISLYGNLRIAQQNPPDRYHGSPPLVLPLDLRTQGFANPEAVLLSRGGKTAWVAHAGADAVSVVDLEKARSLVKPGDPLDLTKTRRYVRARIRVGAAPAGLALSSDGTTLAVTNRLSDSVSLIDTRTNAVTMTVALTDLPADSLRRGERLFHSGRISHTGQFSCASCHPDGKSDGLNWDLPADGFNNFQNTKSLHDLDGTAPYGWLGTSATLEERFTGTLRHLFQYEPTEEEVADLTAYLRSLKTSPSKPASEAGRKLFEKADCAACHAGPKLTDAKLHDMLDAGRSYDTPSLVGVRDTGPYLHDGRAATLESIFRDHNAAGLHGRAAELTDDEFQELMRYLSAL